MPGARVRKSAPPDRLVQDLVRRLKFAIPLCPTSLQASLNTRINLLFLLDALLSEDAAAPQYRPLVASNLPHFIDLVVPPASWDAILNIGSAQQVSEISASSDVFVHDARVS